jgi:cobalt-zinc-cadmium efflux system protein
VSGSARPLGASSTPDRATDRRRLAAVLALTFLTMLAELAGGLWTGSLALLADAGHMLTDVAALALAAGALWVARRPATLRHTYGLHRVEILAALVNGIALWGIVGWIAIEAVGRLGAPTPVLAGPMMGIAGVGLVVNGAALLILHRGHDPGVRRSLNLHGALLHVAGDLLGSVGVLAAGLVVWTTGWSAADPIASLLVCLLILAASWRLVRDAVHILLEGAPAGLDVEALLARIGAERGVAGVHDLHVWTLTSGYPALSAHVVCDHGEEREMVMARVNRLLRQEFAITHTTIQIEAESPPAEPMAHPLETIE